MGISPKYVGFSNNLYEVAKKILANQNLLRYVYYIGIDKHPLDKSLKDVSSSVIFNKHMEFRYVRDEVLNDNRVMLFLNPARNNFRANTLSTQHYVLDIIVADKDRVIRAPHDSQSPIELRAYSIAREVAKSIDGQRIGSIGTVDIVADKADYLTRQYDILSIFFTIHNSNVQGFG